MNNKKDKSKFVAFSVGTVAILIVGCVCFIFLVFQSNVLLDISIESVKSKVNFDRTKVSTVIQEAEDTSNRGGGGGGGGSGGGVMPGTPTPAPTVDITPVMGTVIVYPTVGENIDYIEINNKNNRGTLPRSANDKVTWEFPYDYVTGSGRTEWPTMASRADKIAPYIVPAQGNENHALMVYLNGERYYVGCWPVDTNDPLGSLIEFTFTDGSSIKVLCIDAKSCNDAAGTGSAGQCNTSYSHAVLGDSNTTLSISAIELWCTGGNSSDAVFPDTILKKNVAKAEMIGRTDIFK